MYPILKLKQGKENNVIYRHPWIFSGAIASPMDDLFNGQLVHVADSDGKMIGTGTYSSHSQIAVRVFDFLETDIDSGWVSRRISEANSQRELLGYGPGTQTTGYRLIFGESDGMPGLIIDRYEDVFVIQSSTAGIDRLKETIVDVLESQFKPRAIMERSDIPNRKEEGLEETDGLLYGSEVEEIEFLENGLRFLADVMRGQKTGFFLDQKELRGHILNLKCHGSVLNLFSNSGSFSIAALKSGAESVLNVDGSGPALDLCPQFAEMNGIDAAKISEERADVFEWLSEISEENYDVVMLDPPALIKSHGDMESGKKAYHFLNRAGLRLIRPGGILVTSSCSSYYREDDFLFMLRRASVQTGKKLDVLRSVSQSPDHPISVYFPESRYLKSHICRVL